MTDIPYDALLESVENARARYEHSRCTTAFNLVLLKQAELAEMLNEGQNSEETVSRLRLDIKAHANFYRSLCREIGIQPYNLMGSAAEQA